MAAEGSSREAPLRRLVPDAAEVYRRSSLSVADEITASTAGRSHTDATELIRVDRDRDGR